MITSVIPAFNGIECVVTAIARPAANIVIAAIRVVVDMSCWSCPLAIGAVTTVTATGVLGFDLDAGTIVIKITHRIGINRAVNIAVDIEWVTFVTTNMQCIAAARGGDAAEVYLLDVIARRGVYTARIGGATRNYTAVLAQFPGAGGIAAGSVARYFHTIGNIANLVYTRVTHFGKAGERERCSKN